MGRLQVLISTMFQKDLSFLDDMNIQTDAIVVNQAEEDKIEHIVRNHGKIDFYTFQERGVGLSRNNAMMRATAEISLMADDDVRYYDHYEEMILHAFDREPDTDLLIFELDSAMGAKSYQITKTIPIHFFNYQRYGAAHFAFRTASVRKANCSFSLLFGGGALYTCGEDSIFLKDCLKAGLKIKAVPVTIGKLRPSESTWFHGYTEKYFIDRGRLFWELAGILAPALAVRFAFKKAGESGVSKKEMLDWMLKGIRLQRQ